MTHTQIKRLHNSITFLAILYFSRYKSNKTFKSNKILRYEQKKDGHHFDCPIYIIKTYIIHVYYLI